MGVIELDGIVVPCVPDGSHEEGVTGVSFGRDCVGGPMHDRRSVRRRWGFKTIPVTDREAAGIVGLVNGYGQLIPYTSILNTSKGLVPSGTAVATIVPGIDLQAAPKKVYLESTGIEEAKFWGGSLEMGSAVTNILPADSRDAENAPTGYTARGSASLAAETSIVLQGSKSLKCTTAAVANSGLFTANATVSGIATYILSVYVYATSAYNLRLTAADNGGAWTASDFTTVANSWIRVDHSHTTYGGSTTLNLQVYESAATGGRVFYTDMFQIEEASSASPWVDGTRGTPDLTYKGITDLSDNLTFCAWVRCPTANPSSGSMLFYAYDIGGDNSIQFYRGSGANNLVLVLNSEDVSGSDTYTYATSPWDDNWHHVAFVLSAREDSMYRIVDVYFDGTRVEGTASGATRYPQLKGKVDSCDIGNKGGTQLWEGPIQEILVLPYSMSDSQISSLAGRTRNLAPLPSIDLQGNFGKGVSDGTRDENFKVRGKARSAGYVGMVDEGTHQPMRVVDFSLEEV